MPHMQYKKLPLSERLKWLIYVEEEGKERKREMEKRDETSGPVGSSIDKKKAEALLDNVKENQSKFLRFVIPDEKRHGVLSGKDW